jgi:hypothetical protein
VRSKSLLKISDVVLQYNAYGVFMLHIRAEDNFLIPFVTSSLDKVAALCVGATAAGFGIDLPSGSIEASVAAAGLIGFVVGESEKFGPECERVRRRIQIPILKDYKAVLEGTDGTQEDLEELKIAEESLTRHLGECFLDREKLAACATTRRGFVQQGTKIIIESLGRVNPEIFGDREGFRQSIAQRFARDVIQAGLRSAVTNIKYYKTIEPNIILNMANHIGNIEHNGEEILNIVRLVRDDYGLQVQDLTKRLHARESLVIALISFILERGVSQNGLESDVDQAYTKLIQWRENFNQRMHCCNYCLDTDNYLFYILKYCRVGWHDDDIIDERRFFLKSAVSALRLAENAFPGIILYGDGPVECN